MFRRTTTAALLLALAASGCASTGYGRADDASSSVTAFDDSLAAAHAAAEKSAADLNQVTGGAGDLVPVYEVYRDSVGALEKAVRNADGARGDMTRAADAYFARWGRELELIQDPQISTSSERRMEEVRERFDGLLDAVDELDTALKPFTAEVRDIQRALSVDLSSEGVLAVGDSVRRANQRLAAIRERVNGLRGHLDAVREGLASRKPAPAAGAEK